MIIHREYRKLEDIEEVHIYNVNKKEFFNYMPQEFEITEVPFQKLMNNITNDIEIFIPYNDGKDFIIRRLGHNALKRGNIEQDDVKGRLLSKISPAYHKIIYDSLLETYKTHKTKNMRLLYYEDEKLSKISNIKLIYDMQRVFIISDYIDTTENKIYPRENKESKDNKAKLMEYFSQTGSYYKVDNKYYWTEGIYNIINRQREEHDEYYNIVFDLVIPADRPLVDKMMELMDAGVSSYETLIRIKTDDGSIKYIEINIYSKFDENGKLESRYGLMKDVSYDSNQKIARPVDLLLNGFKNSKKLALLIEPLNLKQYEFSQGFYNIIEINRDEYKHNREILNNIEEKEVISDIINLLEGDENKINTTFIYNVKGDKNNQKICELYIEKFEFREETHSIGFITDITEEKEKEQALIKANENQKVLIKEVHHRVKNNLQILNSFLNLEKRAYKNQPDIIIDHMQSRLTSLALLHEKTYNTSDFKNINLKNYIESRDEELTNLIGLRNGIKFISNVDENLNLSIGIITPLLLVIDEITMNAIKHAFPDKSANNIIIKDVSIINKNTAKLVIKDNGIGIKNQKESMKKNLGCEIIQSLTKQLNGKIKLITSDKGTEYELIFPTQIEHTVG